MHWIALQPAPGSHHSAEAGPLVSGAAELLVDSRTALGWWALRFTPMVARVEEALVLEVSGSERLFGGRAGLVHQLFAHPPVAALRHAQGATSLLALARLWSNRADASVDTPNADRVDIPIDALPVHALAAARLHLPTLSRLGCTTWGQLRALPRGGLARRFGAELIAALDRAYGKVPEIYPWLTLPEVFDAPLELSAGVESAPALLFGARRLLAQLRVWLIARQRGVLALELLWELDARRSNALHLDAHHSGGAFGRLELRTAQATQDMQHLQRLLGEQLARVSLPAPVLHLRLRTLQTQVLSGESWSLLPEDVRTGDSLHQTMERLQARLGADRVLCVQPQASHAPETMQRWQAWTPAHAQAGAVPPRSHPNAALYPGWLLAKPMKLTVVGKCPQYHGPLQLLCGPQRLETGWLEGVPALRDYFVARSPQAGLVWVYRERLDASGTDQALPWFLHGLFA
jgi:protein ImuB